VTRLGLVVVVVVVVASLVVVVVVVVVVVADTASKPRLSSKLNLPIGCGPIGPPSSVPSTVIAGGAVDPAGMVKKLAGIRVLTR